MPTNFEFQARAHKRSHVYTRKHCSIAKFIIFTFVILGSPSPSYAHRFMMFQMLFYYFFASVFFFFFSLLFFCFSPYENTTESSKKLYIFSFFISFFFSFKTYAYSMNVIKWRFEGKTLFKNVKKSHQVDENFWGCVSLKFIYKRKRTLYA